MSPSPAIPVPSAAVPVPAALPVARRDALAFVLATLAALAAKAGWLPVLPW